MKQELHYLLMDPTGNQTILVDTPVPVIHQPAVASLLMEREPGAEQVGFLSFSGRQEISLRMAGGEFCGNASMSAAVYCGVKAGITKGKFTIKVSGATEPVSVTIETDREGVWKGTVGMPQPCSMKMTRFSDGQIFPVVSFPGIAHVILEQEISCQRAESRVKHWCGELGAEALGLMFLNRKEGRLTPLVYVPAADTLFWESACGSGSSAVGAWLASVSGKEETISLQQPGGVLEITASPEGVLLLKGTVRCLYEKTVVFERQDR